MNKTTEQIESEIEDELVDIHTGIIGEDGQTVFDLAELRDYVVKKLQDQQQSIVEDLKDFRGYLLALQTRANVDEWNTIESIKEKLEEYSSLQIDDTTK